MEDAARLEAMLQGLAHRQEAGMSMHGGLSSLLFWRFLAPHYQHLQHLHNACCIVDLSPRKETGIALWWITLTRACACQVCQQDYVLHGLPGGL